MKNMFKSSLSRNGSALLIVLGFLSFMMISAVSFAIYMRIERQATSNYRHALVARHLLHSALARSVAEVDHDLGNTVRFPSDSLTWEGTGRRIYLSGSNASGNGFARVVSFDSLGYVPALFMNDLRYYGVDASWVQLAAPLERVRDSAVNNGIPTFFFGGSNIVGRYAFACLNMSDLFNFNMCTNFAVRDTKTSRVNISYLLSPAAVADLETRRNDDVYYPTVLDFYAAMYSPGAREFPNSPFHAWSVGENIDSLLRPATNHVFVTDGCVRIQKPRNSTTACNIGESSISSSLVSGLWNGKFSEAMNNALPDWRSFSDADGEPIFPLILSDYLSDPSQGTKRLDIPSVKLAPMVYQIALSRIEPKTTIETQGVPPNERKVCSVWPIGDLGGFIQVGLMFPFRNAAALSSRTFTVDAELNVYLFEGDPDASSAPAIAPAGVPLATPTVTASATITVPSYVPRETDSFQSVAIPVSVPKIQLTGTSYDGRNVRVVMVVFVTVRQGGNYFDSVPHRKGMVAGASITSDRNKMVVPKLYFQQAASFLVSDSLAERTWPLEYYSLKCPDPRYNFAAANWYSSASANISDGAMMLQELRSANLLGANGRDGDVFMFVSGLEELQSPGELGFLVRPHRNASAVSRYNAFSEALKNRTDITQLADYDAFYRTVRLYDHGGNNPDTQLRDKVYDYFYTANDDGSIDGARVNPHSDLEMILMAAVAKTPLDYYYAYQNRKNATYANKTFENSTANGGIGSGWKTFSENWVLCMTNSQAYLRDTGANNKRLYELYGDSQLALGNGCRWLWYSGVPSVIFGKTLNSGELFEIDRKMLYSFSLESFSDRQQLFLYIVQAEATGTTVGSSSKSLAGGRAVAVVWRDPDVNSVGLHDTKILYFKQLDN